MSTVIVCSLSPPSQRFVDAYGLPAFISSSVSVIYVCVRRLVDNKFNPNVEPPLLDYEMPSTMAEFTKLVGGLTADVILSDIALTNSTFWLFRYMATCSSDFVYIDYSTAGPTESSRPSFRVGDMNTRLKAYKRTALLRFKTTFFNYRTYDRTITRDPKVTGSSRVLSLPSDDVVTAAEFSKSSNIPDLAVRQYIVFLDVFLPFHQDMDVMNLPRVDPKVYRTQMNQLFDLLEDLFGVPVHICAHPSADYSDDYFNGRAIFTGKTCAMIAGSVFCVSHHSTSVSYAVLFKRQVLFVYTEEMAFRYHSSLLRTQRALARALGAESHLIEKLNAGEITKNSVLEMMSLLTAYEAFIGNFLCASEDWTRFTKKLIDCSVVEFTLGNNDIGY